VYGSYDLILPEHEQIYAYTRTYKNEKLLVILNFSAAQPTFELPKDITFKTKELLISNYDLNDEETIETFTLKPYEARVYLLK
jgi:oligo-1,6-glucosidase